MVILLGLLLSRDALAFYNPQTGRWLSRDPIGERGGINRYCFLKNAPIGFVDANGLWEAGGPLPEGYPDNTIVCDGKGGIRVRLSPKQNWYCPALKTCVTAHEEVHIKDALADNPSICAGKADGTQVLEMNPAKLAASERDGLQTEINCLQNLLKIVTNTDNLGAKCQGCTFGIINTWMSQKQSELADAQKKLQQPNPGGKKE